MQLPEINEFTGLIGALGGGFWFFWRRYQNLEKRLDGIEKTLIELNHSIEILNNEAKNNHDQAIYLAGNNKSLIDHRSERFSRELKELEERLNKSLDDLKVQLSTLGSAK